MTEPRDGDLEDFARDIARHRRLSAPPALRQELRASLLAAPMRLAPGRRSLFSVGALRPVLATLVVVALLAAAGAPAAASSLPGDPAFGLKRAVEEAQVALATDDVARLDTLVTQSDRRIADLETAIARRPAALNPATDEYLAAVGRVDAMLARVLQETATSARDAAIARAAAKSAEHIARLQALAGRLPDAAQQGIRRAIEVQQAVHGKSNEIPGRGGAPIAPTTPTIPSATPGRPSTTPGRGGPPSGVPGRP